MTGRERPALAPTPLYAHDSLYVGIDIGKEWHVAAFVSRTLLESHGRWEACPVLRFGNNRQEFRKLLTRIGEYVPLEQASVLMEKTGHYYYALRDFLQECEVTVLEMAPIERNARPWTIVPLRSRRSQT